MFSDEDVTDEAVKIAEDIAAMCSGRPTASVYIAIGITLGSMEAKAKRPDRAGLFKILGDVMDGFAANNPAGVR